MPTSHPGGSERAGELTSLHVRRAVGGDTDSVSWLVERLNPLLLAQTRWRMGDRFGASCDPADVVQEAWVVLLPRLPQLQQREGRLTPVLLSYLSTSILRKLQNLLRREARRRVHSERDDELPATPEVEHPATGVVSAIVRSERQCQVRAALAELPAADREAVLMRGIEQRSLAEVARHFGVTAKAMSKRYSRALERLRQRLPDSVFAELEAE